MLFDIGLFWCCLHSIEQSVLTSLLVNWFVGGASISVDDFDALWALTDPDNNPQRKNVFINTYRLIPGTCVDAELNEYPCYRLGNLFWIPFAAFSVTDAFVCSEVCDLVSFDRVG